jgi:dynein heavy chain
LPKETVEFEQLNSTWKTIMIRITKDPNAYRVTNFERLDKQLNEMNTKLEEIQKSLDMYLETKKVIFPRFYFISNDDLLEILGQSKNPPAVQPHLKKLFDNIKSLKLQKTSVGSKMEALSMFSEDGEEVPFTGTLTLEGPVEAWLCDVESTMRTTLKEILRQCKASLKKHLNKRDKWVREWPGQLCITASQMQWTADCTKALQQVKSRGDKKPLKSLKKKQTHILNKFSEIIRGTLTKMLRAKIVALVTIEIHARDVIEKLAKSNCSDVNGFEWLMQLRVYWDRVNKQKSLFN